MSGLSVVGRLPRDAVSQRTARWHAVDVVLVLSLLVGLMIAQLALALGGAHPGRPLGLEAEAFRFFPTVLTAYAVLWLAHWRGMTLQGFGFNRRRILLPAFFAWVAAIASAPLFAGLLALAAVGVQAALEMLLVPGLLLLGFSIVVLAPVVEEIIFRALLFRWLRQRWAVLPAAVLSGLVFAAFHLDVATFVPLAITGIAFAWAYDRTGSIWAAITPHAGLNALVLLGRLSAG